MARSKYEPPPPRRPSQTSGDRQPKRHASASPSRPARDHGVKRAKGITLRAPSSKVARCSTARGSQVSQAVASSSASAAAAEEEEEECNVSARRRRHGRRHIILSDEDNEECEEGEGGTFEESEAPSDSHSEASHDGHDSSGEEERADRAANFARMRQRVVEERRQKAQAASRAAAASATANEEDGAQTQQQVPVNVPQIQPVVRPVSPAVVGAVDARIWTPHEALALFQHCPALPFMRTTVEQHKTFPLDAGEWTIEPTDECDVEQSVQQLLVTPQPSDGQSVEPFTFWMRAQHFELTTFKHWLSERSGRYHVVGVKDARDDQVTLLLEAAVRKGVLAESTDTEAQWIEEWGGVDADLTKIVLPFIQQWRDTRPHRLLQLSGNLGGTRPSSHARGQDRRAAFVTLLPRLEAMPLLQRFKSYLQSNQWVAQRVQYSGGYNRAPVAARDDSRVPASFGVAASDRPRLRLCIVVLHLDKDGWVQMDHFGSHSQRLSLVEALARLLDGVRWCVFIVITCGGWPMDTGRQEQLQRLFREHQCALLTSSRPSVPYQDPGDATVDALMRCGADLAVRGLLDVRPEPRHPQKEDGVQPVETMVDQLVWTSVERVLRDSAHNTLPVWVDMQGRVVHVEPRIGADSNSNSNSSGSVPLSPSSSVSHPASAGTESMMRVDAVQANAQGHPPQVSSFEPHPVPQLASAGGSKVWSTLSASVHSSPVLQWLVVQEVHVPDNSGSEAVAAAALPGAAVREPLQYLLVLRGERLAPSEFKNVQQKLCSKYRTTCQHSQGSQRGDGSHVLSDDTARQLTEEYTQPPHPKLWVPKNTRMAGRLLPMRSPMAAKTKVKVTLLDTVRTYEQELLAKL